MTSRDIRSQQKHNRTKTFPKPLIAFLGIAVLFISTVHFVPTNRAAAVDAKKLTTPELINLAVENGEIDKNTSYLYLSYAISDYNKLPDQYKSDIPWEGTPVILQLQEAYTEITDGPDKLTLEIAISGTCLAGPGRNATLAGIETDNFFIEYNSIGGGLTINDYITALEQTWQTEIMDFAWAAPPVVNDNDIGNRYHVIIENLGGGLFGYVSPAGTYAGLVGDNPNTNWDEVDAYASCMVITNDLSVLSSDPKAALEATTAHEFNHAIQFGYGVLSGNNIPDDLFIEAGATWIEDEVFDDSNDNYQFLWPNFSLCMGEYTDSPYSYWITFRGLTEQFGTGSPDGGEQVMQDFWETTSQNQDSSNMLDALNFALEQKGTNLGTAFHNYAIAIKFDKPCTGNYRLPFCLEEGPEYIKATNKSPQVHNSINNIGESISGSIQDNYAINWINLPVGDVNYDVTLNNTSTGGQLRGSLVCDTGDSLSITGFSEIVSAGRSGNVLNYNPSGCSSVIAVITNQSQTASNPLFCSTQSYTISTSEATKFINNAYFPLVYSNFQNETPVVEIPNWNFEEGRKFWTESSSNGWDLIVNTIPPGIYPHSGDWLAWLGGDHNEVSEIKQEISVPFNNAVLYYWSWIKSDEDCGGQLDYVEIVIDETDVIDTYDLCYPNNTNGWKQNSLDLTSYAGKEIEFKIRVQTDGSILSELFLEDFQFGNELKPQQLELNRTIDVPQTVYRKADVIVK